MFHLSEKVEGRENLKTTTKVSQTMWQFRR
jgi:hypothetical protein